MECRHQTGPGPHQRRPGQPPVWEMCCVLGKFSRSQHRLILITPRSKYLPTAIRWSVGTFASAFSFSQENPLRDCHLRTKQTLRKHATNYCESLLFAAKQCIPRGRRKNCVPCWDKVCETLHRFFLKAPVGTDSDRIASSYFHGSTINHRSDGRKLSISLTSRTPAARRAASSINSLADLDTPLACAPCQQIPSPHNLWRMGHTRPRAASPPGSPNKELSDPWKNPTSDGYSISGPARGACCWPQVPESREISWSGSISLEFILHVGSALKSWFCDFLTSCMRQIKIPKIRRRALILVILSRKSHWKTQRAIVLYFCSVFTSRSSRDSSTLVPNQSSTHRSRTNKRAFDTGGSTVDQQVTLLTQDIEDGFSTKKAGAVFVDLTAAYNIVWHRDLTCKLLRLLPDRHMVHMIMEMVGNRSFTLTTGNSKRSRLRRLKNAIAQGSVVVPFFFNIYTSNLPTTVSRKYVYVDDLASSNHACWWKGWWARTWQP